MKIWKFPKALLRSAEVDAELDEWGVMCPVDISLMVARQQFIKMYPRWGRYYIYWDPAA
ncbi:MAG: hypothetical protein Ct9H300mP11_13790 [Chloroflexota bacterium]|nr:MAG: hypothetical protein Ct9H300mP11_13790 [Chloroflexota bacterium]